MVVCRVCCNALGKGAYYVIVSDFRAVSREYPDTRKSGNSHRNCIFARESYSYYCESGDTFS
ncbi:hypothetical protein APHCR_1485 [Anaplasma phagocytophilum str. CR1007]|uniref:hypothetical protein n=1 Tax=Anaplasma phagocytophilum TaxID=948 RepID=UPI00035AA850|nr:hypothetical protein [Anaplasma phagocytophilum]EOA60823.1 hypothetical protein HGE1_02137 [Anaplasma phagocytophilum str. HGE1]KJV82249.1 hypothetical protein APHHGE2_0721 [Anaplasma phagocytophilum str. HGE2]KKA00849.1 hypothetical protein APHCR_1467 [Anaplasma phagocytophilum str. CR1007]AGR81837.1 hypothetical protein YYY_02295 [Anaplasma phagocytophilum str. Dog2]AGR81845.1 hypothetical protein YYY_02370 [Anaplasma phagocytophilum str. Dog2]